MIHPGYGWHTPVRRMCHRYSPGLLLPSFVRPMLRTETPPLYTCRKPSLIPDAQRTAVGIMMLYLPLVLNPLGSSNRRSYFWLHTSRHTTWYLVFYTYVPGILTYDVHVFCRVESSKGASPRAIPTAEPTRANQSHGL